MKRITPDEAVEAYRKTGARPRNRAFGDAGCCCPFFVVAMARFPRLRPQMARAKLRDELGERYMRSFAAGVDGLSPETGDDAVAHADGVAAWAAVEAAGLVRGT